MGEINEPVYPNVWRSASIRKMFNYFISPMPKLLLNRCANLRRHLRFSSKRASSLVIFATFKQCPKALDAFNDLKFYLDVGFGIVFCTV